MLLDMQDSDRLRWLPLELPAFSIVVQNSRAAQKKLDEDQDRICSDRISVRITDSASRESRSIVLWDSERL